MAVPTYGVKRPRICSNALRGLNSETRSCRGGAHRRKGKDPPATKS
jgi:hypothetical protein